MKAKIQEATLRRVDEIWKKHKPQGLGFSDTDVIIVNVETKDKKLFSQDFYCRLKADGTLGHSITKRSEKRQQELKNFIRTYISEDNEYNVKNKIHTWKGKEIEAKRIKGGHIIKI